MPTAVGIGLLALAVAPLLVPGLQRLSFLAPPLLAVVAVASGVLDPRQAAHALSSLGAPLAFVLLAVPLAVMLDELGFFGALARRISAGPRYLGACWLLAALVTALLNLDAAVVLLAPLYVRIAQRRGASRLALSLQPLLLSCLASSALPISNLTNLIAERSLRLTTAGFLEHLGAPTLAATAVGWWCYRRLLPTLEALDPPGEPSDAAEVLPAMGGPGGPGGPGVRRPSTGGPGTGPRRPLLLGGIIVGGCVAGFLGVPSVGGAPWEVAAGGDLLLLGLTRRFPLAVVPWRTVATVLGLGVLAAGAARHLPVAGLVHGSSPLELLRTIGVTTLGASAVNNLPALLVALPALGHRGSWPAWAVLLGTNVGPLLLPSGTLAALLWLETVRRLGVPVGERDHLRLAWRVALPGLAAGALAFLALRILLGGSS